MPEHKIDLSPFCHIGSCRFDIDRPWVKADWEYATDGTICVRRPTILTSKPAGRKVPDAACLFNDFPDCTKKWPPATQSAFRVRCPECNEDASVLAPRQIAGRNILGYYVKLVVDVLGKGVRYCPDGKPEESIAFTCGRVQGLLHPLV